MTAARALSLCALAAALAHQASAASLRSRLPQAPPAKGGVPVSAPVEPDTSTVKISAEDLVKASLPWQGMDAPEHDPAHNLPQGQAFRMTRFSRPAQNQEPWESGDPSQEGTQLAFIPAHAPPEIPRDGDPDARQTDQNPEWFSTVPPVGPAFYTRGQVAPHVYTDSHPQSQGYGAPGAVGPPAFLQLGSSAWHGLRRPHAHSAYGARVRHTPVSWRHDWHARVAASFARDAAASAPASFLQLGAGRDEPFLPAKMGPPSSNVPFTPASPVVFDSNDAKMIRAVTGELSGAHTSQLNPPPQQQFNGFGVDGDPHSPGPHAPYASGHPDMYQPAPQWPPAPPEPLFPLKSETADLPQPPAPLPGPKYPYPSGADFGHFQTPGAGTPYIGDQRPQIM